MKPLIAKLPSVDDPLAFLSACHERVEERLRSLEAAAAALSEPGHPRWAEAVEAIQAAAGYFLDSARRHHEDEDDSLFPRLRNRDPALAGVLQELQAQHRSGHGLHERLRTLALAIVDPDETPRAVAELPRLVADLTGHYRPHIRTEEEQVFTRAREVLTRDDLLAVAEEMRGRRRG